MRAFPHKVSSTASSSYDMGMASPCHVPSVFSLFFFFFFFTKSCAHGQRMKRLHVRGTCPAFFLGSSRFVAFLFFPFLQTTPFKPNPLIEIPGVDTGFWSGGGGVSG